MREYSRTTIIPILVVWVERSHTEFLGGEQRATVSQEYSFRKSRNTQDTTTLVDHLTMWILESMDGS